MPAAALRGHLYAGAQLDGHAHKHTRANSHADIGVLGLVVLLDLTGKAGTDDDSHLMPTMAQAVVGANH